MPEPEAPRDQYDLLWSRLSAAIREGWPGSVVDPLIDAFSRLQPCAPTVRQEPLRDHASPRALPLNAGPDRAVSRPHD